LPFLKTIDRQTPCDLDIHLIADNYVTHKGEDILRKVEAARQVSAVTATATC
jgi:hypothetical protein